MSILSQSMAGGLSASLWGRNDAVDASAAQLAPVDGRSYVAGDRTIPLRHATVSAIFSETVSRFGPREAAVFPQFGKRYTFYDLDREVDAFAGGLLSLGLNRGDRLGIWAPNRPEWLITQFATARVGVVLVNINPAYRLSELEYALNKVGCKALVTAASFKSSDYISMIRQLAPEIDRCEPGKLAAARLPALKAVIRMGSEKTAGMLNFDDVPAMGGPAQIMRLDAISSGLDPDDAINIQFTSGTTGSPKGATLTHYNIVNNATFNARAMGFTEADRVCIPVPLYHCFGMVMGTLACVASGATMVFPAESFDAGVTLATVAAERCTALYGVPTMFVSMLDHPDFGRHDYSALRTGVMAGAPCPIEVMRRVITDLHMPQVTIGYGMTETSPLSFQSRMDDALEDRVGTVGRVHPHVEVKIIDKDGRTTPVGERGELCTRGYSVMRGYWNDEERTRESIDEGGWMHTGDLATIDERGYCRIVGRVKDMVIRGGENVYPREIEEYLYRHPSVAEVQVFGVPDATYGEEVCAWIVLHKGSKATEDDIKAFCRGQIAHYKIPKYIRFKEALPMTVTGKAQKFVMRDAMIAELESGTDPERSQADRTGKGAAAVFTASGKPKEGNGVSARPAARGYASYAERVERFRLDDALAEVFGDATADLNACVLCCDRHCGSGKVALRWVSAAGDLKTYTFEDLRKMSIRGAHMLTRAGVRKGDVVAALLPRIPELVAVILATWRIGAVYQPLFTAFGPKAIEHRFATAGTRLVVTNSANRGKLADIANCPTVATLVAPGETLPSGDIDLRAALNEGPDSFEPVACKADDLIMMMSTSGTTGLPKGVPVTIAALPSFAVYMRDAVDLREDDVYWNIADPGWAYGLYYAVTGPLLIGRSTLLYEGAFTVESTYDIIDRVGVTNLAGSPTAYRGLIAAGAEPAARIKGKLRVVSSAGEPLNPEVIRWFDTTLAVQINDHYGQTETGMTVNNHHGLDHPVRIGSAGYSMPGYRVAVLDDTGRELGPNQPGILAVDIARSPLMWFKGYYRTATPVIKDGYYLTGDTVELTDDGSISFVGRADDVITTSGYRIGPFDVESALIEHPAVTEAAVVGVPDPERTEIVKAFVILASGFRGSPQLAEELRLYVRQRLSAHAYPREIDFVTELPKTPSGKIQRFLLRKAEVDKRQAAKG